MKSVRPSELKNTLALLIPNHFVLDDCPRDKYTNVYIYLCRCVYYSTIAFHMKEM